MALKIMLKPGERAVINGALVRSNGSQTAELLIDNQARVLRESALMSEVQANTPARRLYFAAQLAYVDEANLDRHRRLFLSRFEDLAAVISNDAGRALLHESAIAAARLDWWKTLQAARKLINYEAELLAAKLAPTALGSGEGAETLVRA